MALESLKSWAEALRREVLALWIAARDPRTPVLAKIVAAAVAAYAFSPIDLIPDVIPVLGYLDDLLILPLGIWLAIRLIPAPLMTEYRERATREAGRPVSLVGAVVIVGLWALAVGLLIYALAG